MVIEGDSELQKVSMSSTVVVVVGYCSVQSTFGVFVWISE